MKNAFFYNHGNTLSYTDFGNKSGYPILLQHGLIASIEDFDLFEGLIQLGARLISIARPGYGDSSPYAMKNVAEWGEIVSGLVEQLQLARFDVLGMSSGAPYSYAIGHRFPDNARNIFIFSGIPALFDDRVVSHWPYPVSQDASLAEMQTLAYQLFFADLSEQDRARPEIHASMMNHCFGPALDFRIRGMDWGFPLSEIHQPVFMQHSRLDEGYTTAEITSQLLPNCTFISAENAGHFSKALLDEFIRTVMAGHY